MVLEQILPLVDVEHLDSRVLPRPVKGNKKSETTKTNTIIQNAGPSRWGSMEFKFYYLMFVIVVPNMIWAGYRTSSEHNLNYYKYQDLLSSGWLFGRKVDNSDAQYRFFREHLIELAALLVLHTTIKRIVLALCPISKIRFDTIFGVLFLYGAYGVNSIRVLAHVYIMFSIAHIFKNSKRLAILFTWVYGIGSLFINDKYYAYAFSNFSPSLRFLDEHSKGLIPRWDVFYNFLLLRMISYNIDFLNRYNTTTSKSKEENIESKKENEMKEVLLYDDKARMNVILPVNDYNPLNHIAYITYAPLFIAGPIITYNDYIFQSTNKLPSLNKKFILWYAARFLCTLFLMELVLHFFYVVAISKRKAWEGDSPFEIAMIGLINLNIIWFKLAIPWRFFRLWGLLDGIDTPENMIRCVYNNYSALAFWRAWHRSYNKWVIRYIYIPLGGSKSRIVTSLAVFSFVAIWHDIELRLLLWGWIVVLFLLPEMFATQYFVQYSKKWWYRHICALGGALNIYLMMIANLFGFCLGSDGMKKLLADMFSTCNGLTFLLLSFGSLFIGVQLMFEIREEEKRKGIDLKC